MTKSDLLKRVAYLESLNDQLVSEINYVDHLMRLVGFADGLAGVKSTAEEVLHEGSEYPIDDNTAGLA